MRQTAMSRPDDVHSRPVFLVYLVDRGGWNPLADRFFQQLTPGRYKLGLLQLQAVLERQGTPTQIWDQSLDDFTLDELVAACRQARPQALGLYTAFQLRDTVVPAMTRLRADLPALPILCGGPGCAEDRFYLERGCDVMVQGEGEETLPAVLAALAAGEPLDEIPGIAFRAGGEIRRTPPRPPVPDLDALPPLRLTRRLVEWNSQGPYLQDRGLQISMMASRGCPFSCTYCSVPSYWGHQLRLRSVPSLFAEIDAAVERFGVSFVEFFDDVFGWDREWLEVFLVEMERRPALGWRCILHPFSFRDDPETMLARLGAAGLQSVSIGLQSIDPEVARLLNRAPGEPAALARLLAATRQADVFTVVQLIFGLAADQAADVRRLLAYLRRVRPNMIQGFPYMHLPGSRLAADHAPSPLPPGSEAEVALHARWLFRHYYLSPQVAAMNTRFLLRRNRLGFLVRQVPQIGRRVLMGGFSAFGLSRALGRTHGG